VKRDGEQTLTIQNAKDLNVPLNQKYQMKQTGAIEI